MEGIRKLQEYEIIIHPSCKNAEIEFSNYTFDKDKNTDQWLDKPIDDFCHLIDAARYATQCGSQRKQLQTFDKSKLGFQEVFKVVRIIRNLLCWTDYNLYYYIVISH